jgi:phosphatidylglycerophosphate synthase
MQEYTYEDIKKGLLVETYLYFKLLAYVFAAPLSYLSYRIGISPNQISVFGISLVCPAIYFNLQGDYVFGLLMFHLFFFCDAVDGVLARGTNRKSILGAYLDDLAHFIFHTGFFITLGFSLHQAGHTLLGMWVVLFLILDNLNRAHWELLYNKVKVDPKAKDAASKEIGEHILVKIRNIILGSFTFPNVLVWMSILMWNLEMLQIYFMYAVIMSLLYFLYVMLKTIRNIKNFQK